MIDEISANSIQDQDNNLDFSTGFAKNDNSSDSSSYESENTETGDQSPGELLGLRILLVDDSPDNRFLVRAFLKHEQCYIEEAANGNAAIEKFENAQWDVVLMDMQMPDVDGYEATVRIREIEAEKDNLHVPIVALTAYSLDEEVQKCIDIGCDMYLSKPIDKMRLIEAIYKVTKCLGIMDASSATDKPSHNKDKSIKVRVDPDLMGLIPGYLKHRREDIDKINTLLEAGDLRSIERCGHSMKGTGSSYGFDVITQLGAFLEQAGKSGNIAEIKEAVEKLTNYLDNLELLEME